MMYDKNHHVFVQSLAVLDLSLGFALLFCFLVQHPSPHHPYLSFSDALSLYFPLLTCLSC